MMKPMLDEADLLVDNHTESENVTTKVLQEEMEHGQNRI